MSDFDTAARPYARALFELASDEGNLQAWQELSKLFVSLVLVNLAQFLWSVCALFMAHLCLGGIPPWVVLGSRVRPIVFV